MGRVVFISMVGAGLVVFISMVGGEMIGGWIELSRGGVVRGGADAGKLSFRSLDKSSRCRFNRSATS